MGRSTPIGTVTADGDATSADAPDAGTWTADQAHHELVCSTPAELDQAWAARNALVRAAIALLTATGHDPDVARCAAAGCALAELDAVERCELVHHLAALDLDVVPVATDDPDLPPERPARALEVFDRALVAGLDAVRACRRTVHPIGRCWFTSLPGGDGCRQVLAAGHRVR